jgi:hypothetical protein
MKNAVSPAADDAKQSLNIGPPALGNPPNGTFNGTGVADPNPAGGRNPAANAMPWPGTGFARPPR